jgi:flagellar biosynthesis/type III secretory pathway M-ring protein FliF/YscJ
VRNSWTRLSRPKKLALAITLLALVAAAAVVAVWMTQGTGPDEVVDFLRRHVDQGRSRHGD